MVKEGEHVYCNWVWAGSAESPVAHPKYISRMGCVEYWDDARGGWLRPELVHAARQEEIGYIRKHKHVMEQLSIRCIDCRAFDYYIVRSAFCYCKRYK